MAEFGGRVPKFKVWGVVFAQYQHYNSIVLIFVQTCAISGFTRQQAEGMAEALTEIINTTLDHQSRHMITKKQQVTWDGSEVT